MRNHSLVLWILLFVDGVFGAAEVAVSVSVMKGDSVTLHTDVSELQNDDIIDWMSEDGVIIAKIENKKISEKYVPEKKFEGRLELDHKTGSLTIKNITSQHKGIYKLDIGGGHLISKNFSVTVHDDVESLSVMEGDSVTLHTGVTKIQKDDVIRWFGDQGTCIAALNSAYDQRWSNIHLNNQTGDLTIRNIQMKQSGVYKVEINTIRILHMKFKITVDEMTIVMVKEEESIILHTGTTNILGYDLILWKFEDHLMAKINRTATQVSIYNNAGGRFKGRLQLHPQTGSFIISETRITDSGDYHLNMNSITHSLQRTYNVTVKAGVKSGNPTQDTGLHPGYIALICVCVVLVPVVVAAGAFVIYYRCREQSVVESGGSVW